MSSVAPKTDSAKTPMKTRTVDSDGDYARKHATTPFDKGMFGAHWHHLCRLLICLIKNSADI